MAEQKPREARPRTMLEMVAIGLEEMFCALEEAFADLEPHQIWQEGLAKGHLQGSNPFDEFSERIWSDVWLFYANSVRFTSSMGCGGDYGVFADGRYHLARGVRELEDWLNLRRK